MYSYNPYYEKYLMHYGTKEHSGRYPYGSGERPYQRIAMMPFKKAAAIRASSKAFTYAKDINAHRRNQAVRAAKLSYKRGEITKQEYKDTKIKENQKLKEADIKSAKDIVNLRDAVTGNSAYKVNEIYSKYKETAYNEIPNYLAKRGIRFAAQITPGILAGIAINKMALAKSAVTNKPTHNVASALSKTANVNKEPKSTMVDNLLNNRYAVVATATPMLMLYNAGVNKLSRKFM